MMENGSIRQLLHNRHVAIVDGAMATELEKHGVDTSGELWSPRRCCISGKPYTTCI